MKPLDVGKQFEFNWYSRKAAMNLGGIRLMQLGTVCCEPGYEIAPHTQWCYEISYFISGNGTFITDGKETPIHCNEVFLTPLGSIHSIAVGAHEPLHYSYLGFAFDETCTDAELMQLRSFFSVQRSLCTPGNQELLLAFYRAVGELANPECFSPMLLTAYVQTILIMSMRLFSSEATNAHLLRLDASMSSNETIYYIMKAIDDHLTTINSISEFSQQLGYHPCYLSHHFKKKTGMTLQEYIARKKIERAIGLLRFSPLSITQVAERSGFSTLQSFSRAFKRITGLSPSRFCLQEKMDPDISSFEQKPKA